MKIGVISEGHADRAVITNVIAGLTGIDPSQIEAIRPIDNYDETDKAILDPKSFGGWTAVKEECEKREMIDLFLAIEGQDFIAIHIDTAEAESYGIKRPDKNAPNYCEILRELLVQQINIWLKEDLASQVLYAIAIEEIEAWILTIYDQQDSTRSAKPKEKLSKILGKKEIKSTSDYDNFLEISKPL